MRSHILRYLLLFVVTSPRVFSAVAQSQPPDTLEVRSAHQSWFRALVAEDVPALDRLLSNDITLGFGYRLLPRADLLRYLGSGELSYSDAEHLDVQIRRYGGTAVVTGRSNLGYRFGAQAGHERLRYSAVWVQGENGWRLVAWQSAFGPAQ